MLSSRPISLLHDDAQVATYSRTTASKTPGRALKGRAGLQENMFQHGSITTNPREKRAVLQTPFRQENSKIVLQDVPASSKAPMLSTRPLVDKTPLPNLQNMSLFTPLPRNGKSAKFTLPALLDGEENGSPMQPPSSSRKKLRVPRTASKSFETPITKGDHWNVSDVSIDVGANSLDEVDEADANEPDYSEPEYMPPKTVEPAFEFPFELPNYKDVGETLLTLAHSYPIEDAPSNIDKVDPDELLQGCGWSSSSRLMDLSLPDSDEDNIFGHRKVTKKPEPIPSVRGVASRISVQRIDNAATARPTPISRVPSVAHSRAPPAPLARPATSATICVSDSSPASIVPRPGTSACNVRRPLTRNATATGVTARAATVTSSSNARTSSVSKLKVQDDALMLQFVDEMNKAPGPDEDFRFDI